LKCAFDGNFTTRVEVSMVFGSTKSHYSPNATTKSVYVVTDDLQFKKLVPRAETDKDDSNPISHFRQGYSVLPGIGESLILNESSPLSKIKEPNFSQQNLSKKSIQDANLTAQNFGETFSYKSHTTSENLDESMTIQGADPDPAHKKSTTIKKPKNKTHNANSNQKISSKNEASLYCIELNVGYNKELAYRQSTIQYPNLYKEVAQSNLTDYIGPNFKCEHMMHLKGLRKIAIVGHDGIMVFIDTKGNFMEKVSLSEIFMRGTRQRLKGQQASQSLVQNSTVPGYTQDADALMQLTVTTKNRATIHRTMTNSGQGNPQQRQMLRR
jgi:hypothetical protein